MYSLSISYRRWATYHLSHKASTNLFFLCVCRWVLLYRLLFEVWLGSFDNTLALRYVLWYISTTSHTHNCSIVIDNMNPIFFFPDPLGPKDPWLTLVLSPVYISSSYTSTRPISGRSKLVVCVCVLVLVGWCAIARSRGVSFLVCVWVYCVFYGTRHHVTYYSYIECYCSYLVSTWFGVYLSDPTTNFQRNIFFYFSIYIFSLHDMRYKYIRKAILKPS